MFYTNVVAFCRIAFVLFWLVQFGTKTEHQQNIPKNLFSFRSMAFQYTIQTRISLGFCFFASGNLSTEPKSKGSEHRNSVRSFLLDLPNKLNFGIGLRFFEHQWKWIKKNVEYFGNMNIAIHSFHAKKKSDSRREKSWHRKIWWWKILYRRNWEETQFQQNGEKSNKSSEWREKNPSKFSVTNGQIIFSGNGENYNQKGIKRRYR